MCSDMKKNAIIFIAIGVVVVGLVIFRFATGKVESPESIDDIQKREGIPVEVLTLQKGPFERWKVFSGSVEGKEQATLYSNIPARVKKVNGKQGDKISSGRTIINLDPLSSAQTYSALNMARVRTKDAKRLYERMEPLYNAGAVSKEDFDQVKSGYEIARAGLTDVTYTTKLKSPIRGILTDLRVNVGDKVDPGQTLAMVADLSSMKVIFDASQSEVEEIKVGQPVIVGKDKNKRNKTDGFDGELSKISLSADLETRLFRAEAKLEPNDRLKPGTIQYIQIRTYRNEEAITVPINAVLERQGEFYLFVVSPSQTAQKRKVSVGKPGDKSIEIVAGLEVGEQIIVFGQNRLTGDEKIKVVEQK